MSSKSAIIIGSGFGGLAVANLLAKDGWRVTVIEKRHQLGGRAGRLKVDGYTFDTGPSWYLMPEVFEHYFNLFGKDVNKELGLVRLDPAYKVFYDYRDSITVRSNEKEMKQVFDSVEPGSGVRLSKYLDEAEETYKLAIDYILYNSRRLPSGLVNKRALPKLTGLLPRLRRPLHNKIEANFKSLELQQILEYPMVFLGSSPFEAPSIFSLMSYLDFRQGVYFPKGGMYEIVLALEKLGRELGVEYILDTEVISINVEGGVAGSVTAGDREFKADLVISNSDLKHTETRILDEKWSSYKEEYWQKKQAGPSAMLMYLGVEGELPQLEHHSLLFVEDWAKNFDAIFKDKQLPQKPSMYVSRISETDKTSAPKGCENIFVLVPLPSGMEVPSSELEEAADRYIDQIGEMTNIKEFAKRIKYRKIYGPSDFSNDFYSWDSTALGMSHLLTQSAWWRPNSNSKKVKNLMYVGAGVQPGIGVPMTLISAELAYKKLTGQNTVGPLAESLKK